MRILAVADVESRYYYEHYAPGRLADFDLILACGDLSRDYLEFLVTMARCPRFYVPGNHDGAFLSAPPEGCVCLDGRILRYGGLRFFGLGGAYRYRPGPYLYTEEEMRRRVRRAWPGLLRHGGFDVLVTHAPARHLNDLDTLPHRGFQCFNRLIERYQPRCFVHGHVHLSYGMHLPRRVEVGGTAVINAYEHCVIELESQPARCLVLEQKGASKCTSKA